jgi:hypothetical protein
MSKLKEVLMCYMNNSVLDDCITVIDRKMKKDVSLEDKKSYCEAAIKRRILNENLSIQQIKEVFKYNPSTFNEDVIEKILADIDVLLDHAAEELFQIVEEFYRPSEK